MMSADLSIKAQEKALGNPVDRALKRTTYFPDMAKKKKKGNKMLGTVNKGIKRKTK